MTIKISDKCNTEAVDEIIAIGYPENMEYMDESLRILTDRELIDASEISKISKRNLFVYNLWIKETLEASEKAIYSFPLRDHRL